MDVFIGRQPILSCQQKTIAYELLFRRDSANRFDGTEDHAATTTVIANTFMTMGSDRALGTKLGFLNFPRKSLVEDQAFLLPREKVVIEVLENVEPDDEVIAACKRLKKAGYRLALDDLIATGQAAPLVPYAYYAKIDFRALGRTDRRLVGHHFRRRGLRLLAEKVETKADFQAAFDDGYELFQGYFFARPEIISAREIPSSKLNCIRLLSELHRPELDFKRVEELLRHDVALVRKLLCFVNSAAFPHREKIESISHGLAALGESNIRKWAAMAALPALASDRPDELVNASLVRARFCELAAAGSRIPLRAGNCFLAGLLSLLDVMMGRPLGELVAEMAIDPDVSAAILNGATVPDKPGPRVLLQLAVAFEGSERDAVSRWAAIAEIEVAAASELYVQAIEWADALYREKP